MAVVLYHVHSAARDSATWRAATRYRLTPERVLRLLGHNTYRNRTDLVSEILGEMEPPVPNDPQLWYRLHQEDARRAHQQFEPEVQRMTVGLCVNAEHPWLAYTPGDLTWNSTGDPGINDYRAPYSKQLYRLPHASHELELAYGSAVLAWSRPLIDFVTWTPAAAAVRHYTPESVLVQQAPGSSTPITMRELWEQYLWPQLHEFYTQELEPALRSRGLEPETVYRPATTEYIAVSDPRITPTSLVTAFREL